MTVVAGELRAVIGPNGAGKTTFFNLISGFLRPTSGHIVFDDEDVTVAASRPAASGAAWRAPFRSPRFFRSSQCVKISASLSKLHGFRLRPWLSRQAERDEHVGG